MLRMGQPACLLTDAVQPEVLYDIAGYLDARSCGSLGGTCRLLTALTDAAQRRPFITVDMKPLPEVVESTLPRLAVAPSFMVVFSENATGNKAAVQRALDKLPPFTHVIGTSMSGVQIHDPTTGRFTATGLDSSLDPGQASVMMGHFPGAQMKTFQMAGDQAGGEELLVSAGLLAPPSAAADAEATPEWKVFVLLSSDNPDQVMNTIQARFPKAAIIGGIGQTVFSRSAGTKEVVCDEHAVAGLAFAGNVPLQALVSRGTRALGVPAVITQSEECQLSDGTELVHITRAQREGSAEDEEVQSLMQHAFNDMNFTTGMNMVFLGTSTRPVLNEGSAATPAPASQSAAASPPAPPPLRAHGSSADGPSGEQSGFFLHPIEQRHLLAGGIAVAVSSGHDGAQRQYHRLGGRAREQTQQASGAVAVEERLRFFQLDSESCREDVVATLARAKAQLKQQGRVVFGSLLFSCAGRGPHRFAGRQMMDAEAFRAAFPDVPLCGLYAGGEIGPLALADCAAEDQATQSGDAALQGFTAVFGLFSVPEAVWRSNLPSTMDTSADGLASYMQARVPRPTYPAPVDLRALSVKDLRSLIAEAGLRHTDCLEKADLVARARQAQQRLGR